MIDWSDYPNFTEAEMRCKCGCGRADMNPDYMARLQLVRDDLGVPMLVNSGFRCLDYDASTGGAGVHPTGQAGDFGIAGEPTYNLLFYAFARGMRGIGMRQHGVWGKRFVHLDDLKDWRNSSGRPVRPRIWTYP